MLKRISVGTCLFHRKFSRNCFVPGLFAAAYIGVCYAGQRPLWVGQFRGASPEPEKQIAFSLKEAAKNNEEGSSHSIDGLAEGSRYRIEMPMGNKVCVFGIKSRYKLGIHIEKVLEESGISPFYFHSGIKSVYSALSKFKEEELSFAPMNFPLCEWVRPNSDKNKGQTNRRFQLFMGNNVIRVVFYPQSTWFPPIPPEKMGVEWDRFRAGMKIALRALYKDMYDIEFDNIAAFTSPIQGWEYRIPYILK